MLEMLGMKLRAVWLEQRRKASCSRQKGLELRVAEVADRQEARNKKRKEIKRGRVL